MGLVSRIVLQVGMFLKNLSMPVGPPAGAGCYGLGDDDPGQVCGLALGADGVPVCGRGFGGHGALLPFAGSGISVGLGQGVLQHGEGVFGDDGDGFSVRAVQGSVGVQSLGDGLGHFGCCGHRLQGGVSFSLGEVQAGVGYGAGLAPDFSGVLAAFDYGCCGPGGPWELG